MKMLDLISLDHKLYTQIWTIDRLGGPYRVPGVDRTCVELMEIKHSPGELSLQPQYND